MEEYYKTYKQPEGLGECSKGHNQSYLAILNQGGVFLHFTVKCSDCSVMSGYNNSEEEAIFNWNRKTNESWKEMKARIAKEKEDG